MSIQDHGCPLPRQNLLATLDQFVVSGANFLLILICAHSLQPLEQGKLGYIIAANFAVVMIGITSIFQLASVEAARQSIQSTYRESLAAFQVILAFLVAAGVTALVLIAAKSASWSASTSEVLLLFSYLFAQQLADFDRRSSYIFGTAERALASSILMYGLRFGLLIFIRPYNVADVLFILITSSILPALITTHAAIKGKSRASDIAKFFYKQIRKSSWLIASGPLSWVWGNAITFLVGALVGLPAVAVLVTLRSIANIANVGLELIETRGAVVLSRLENVDPRAFYRAIRSISKNGVLIWSVGLALLLLAGETIVELLYDDYYSEYWLLLIGFWVVNLGIFVFKVSSLVLRIHGHTKEIFISYLAGSIAAILFIFVGIRMLDLSGGVVGMVLSTGVLCGTVWWKAKSIKMHKVD